MSDDGTYAGIILAVLVLAAALWGCSPATHRLTLPPDDPPKCQNCK